MFTDKVHLKCSQTGDKFVAPIDDVLPGLNVIANVEGAYPAEIISLDGIPTYLIKLRQHYYDYKCYRGS